MPHHNAPVISAHNAPVISAHDIRYSYHNASGISHDVLHGCDVDVHPSEWVALVGESGSGKSTLLNILGLLQTLQKGEYSFLGKDITTLKNTELDHLRRTHFGFVFQDAHVIKERSVLENVAMPLRAAHTPHKDRTPLAHNALDIVGIPELGQKAAGSLSGGQRQRVAIARAIVHKPTVLLCDEPTGSLDSHTTGAILGMFNDLRHHLGCCIVTVTHEETVSACADRIVSMVDGVIVDAT